MFCLRCGKELPNGSSFCSKCGAEILANEKVKDNNSSNDNGTIKSNINFHVKKHPFKILSKLIFPIIGIILFTIYEYALYAINNYDYQIVREYLYIKYIVINIILIIFIFPLFIKAVTDIKRNKSFKIGFAFPLIIIIMVIVMGNVYIKDTEKTSTELSDSTTIAPSISNNALTIAVSEIVNVSGAVRMNVSIKNNSGESILVSPYNFTLSITNGNTYNSSLGDSTVDTVTLQPGQQTTGYLTFTEDNTADASGTQTLNFNGDSDTTQQVTVEVPAIR